MRSRSFRHVLFPQSQISDLFIFALTIVWQCPGRNVTAIVVPHYLALWIKQNPSKLSNLMVLDNNIVTSCWKTSQQPTEVERPFLVYRRMRQFETPIYSSSKSTKQNRLASWWNHCTSNVCRIIKRDAKLSHISTLRFTAASEVICTEEAKRDKNLMRSSAGGKNLASSISSYPVLWSLCRTSTDIKSSSVWGSERVFFAQ